MKDLLKKIFTVFKGSFRLVYFAIAVMIVLLVSYFLGYSYLQNILGNDSFFHLSNIFWFDKFFPQIPYWYPLQNGGVVTIWGYPVLSYLIVILIHRLSDLSLAGAYQLLGFLSVPLTALGLYLFVWTRLKNQTMAAIAAVFYLLMPISWVWLFDWGFYTESISYIFIFPTLIFYDTFLKAYLEDNLKLPSRIAFLLAVLFLALTFLTHPNTFFILLLIAFVLSILEVLEKRKSTIFPFSLFAILTLFLLSFILLDFYSYAKQLPVTVSDDGLKENFLKGYATPVDSLLGLAKIPPTEFKFGHRNIVIPPLVWTTAILGFFGSIILSRKVLALAFLSALPIIYFEWPILAWYTIKYVPFSTYYIHHRAILIFIRVLIPIVAAFGIYSMARILLDLPLSWILHGKFETTRRAFIIVTTSIFSLILTILLIIYFANKPESLWKKYEVRYGPYAFDIRNPFAEKKNFKNYDVDIAQITTDFVAKENWPRPKLINNLSNVSGFPNFMEAHKDEKMLRIDISPYLGGEVMRLNMVSEISQINIYATQLSLIGPYWWIEQMALFSHNTGNTINVNNIVKWFGIKYLFFNNGVDELDKYREDPQNWKEIDKAGIWKFANPTEMYAWTIQKPTILVIGSLKKRAFEPVFRAAINGGLPYEDGWLVQGRENIDDYSLFELKNFDAIILYGYSYKNRNNANKILEQYVKEGGNLYISTGWQYTDGDWESDITPDFFPIESLVWSADYPPNSPLSIEDKEITGEVDTTKFSPLKWNDQPWGVSISKTDIRLWAKTVLSLNGKPLVAGGNYGKGRVIWSGLDLIAHVSTYNYNKEEMSFINNLFKWLNKGRENDEKIQTQKVIVERNHPDKVEFTFNDSTSSISTLYWRENQFPNWQATLISPKGEKSEIKIYKGGPGFMLMRLPPVESNSILSLEFKTGVRTFLGRLVSLITLVGLITYVIRGGRFLKVITIPANDVAQKIIKRTKRMISHWWNKSEEEEEY